MAKKKTQEELDEISFSNLVKAINEKWGHTYIDPPKEPEYSFYLKETEKN